MANGGWIWIMGMEVGIYLLGLHLGCILEFGDGGVVN